MKNNINFVDMDLKFRHRPISDYRMNFTNVSIPGMEGVLGVVPGLSVRAPKPVVSLRNPETGVQIRSMGCKKCFSSMGRVLLSIEQSLIIVLEIEDLDSIIKNIQNEDQTFNKNNLLKQRVERSEELFKSLHLLDPEVKENKIRYDDEYFLKLFTIPKGIQLVRYCLVLLFLKQSVLISCAMMRNLNTLINLPTNEKEEKKDN